MYKEEKKAGCHFSLQGYLSQLLGGMIMKLELIYFSSHHNSFIDVT